MLIDILLGLVSFAPAVVFVVVVVAVFSGAVRIVRQQHVLVVERFGKFNRVAGAGLRLLIPVVERGNDVSLLTQDFSGSVQAKTSDDVTVGVAISVQYRVDVSPSPSPELGGVYLSQYTLANPVAQMKDYFSDALRSRIPNYTLDEVFGEKDAIAEAIHEVVAGKMAGYGYEVVNTLIVDIVLPDDLRQSMNDIRTTANQKIAAQNEADADRARVVTAARAEAEASLARGEGVANMRKALAAGIRDSLETIKGSGVTAEEANELFMYEQYVDMMESFADKGASTVILPADFREHRSMFEQMVAAGAGEERR